MKNYTNFNTAEIMPDWNAWNNNCNLTVHDSFIYVYQRYKILYWACFASNIITLIAIVICYFTDLYIHMIMYLLAMIITVAVICFNIVDNYNDDYVINGMSYYQQVHNILLLTFYLVISILMYIKMLTIIKKDFDLTRVQNKEELPLLS